ncbi:MAG: HD domain-containing protein [Bacteroidales bacterium]|nr:HD domain-containing protein [Bacteroidales bacterium]
MTVIDDFQNRIDHFLESILAKENRTSCLNSKIIHDSVWGTNSYYSWEIGLIDSPILQRLRRIHQTGLAFLVFPTATHTRFEHSLGVTVLVENLIHHLDVNKKDKFISEEERYNLRLAAILHDIGHSFFSHVSELVYERMQIFQDLTKEIFLQYKGVKPKGHEIFSFMMVRSKVFKKYFDTIIARCNIQSEREYHINYLKKIDWNLIAGWIIGYSENPGKMYLSEIINGPIDCDKLDYLARDSKFAGPVIIYDIDRFYYTLNTIKIDNCETLTVTLGGVTALEQILISRMMMFSYIYHHHKVRSSEAMLKRLCFDIIKDKHQNNKNAITIKLEHPVDFLKYTDDILVNSCSEEYSISGNSKAMIENIYSRNLWVRGMLVSGFNIEGEEIHSDYLRLEFDLHCDKNIQELKDLKEKIIKEIKLISPSTIIETRDIWIDVPKPPNADEALKLGLKKSHTSTELPLPLSDVFPISAWIDTYKARRWRSHIFCRKEHQQLVYKASKKVLSEIFKIEIQEYTSSFCKIYE